MPEPVLKIEGVTKTFPGAEQGTSIPVLRDVCLEASRGESVALTGPSGSGKSTLLHIIGGLDKPDSGSVHVSGVQLSSLDEAGLARMRNRCIGFVFQAHYLLPQCTVLENVLIPVLAERSSVSQDTDDRAKRLLDRVGLGSRVHHLAGRLSGGERQRVALVRALILKPVLLLADEPTGSLDAASAQTISALLVELNSEQQTTLVVATHSAELAEKMQRVVRLREGHLLSVH